ncbi:MAG: M24 family metallopeptidase [Acidobacteriota bacterium]|nr:M24 family metallopeptidase [Acidobacteriota bacterium]
MTRYRKPILAAAGLILALAVIPAWAAQNVERPAVLDLKTQSATFDSWLKIRLERILPELMRQEGFDMWLVICRESNEDPVFMSLVPFNQMYASRLSILVFTDKGSEGVERLSLSRRPPSGLYQAAWEPEKIGQWERLAQIIKERNPKRIGIDESPTFNYADGLSASLKASLLKALPPEYASRLHSAERLALRLLERRSPEELEVYPHIVAVAHGIIAEAFSRRVITPGVTTTDDVVWWMRERTRELGQTNWFQPSVEIQRPKSSPYGNSPVIHRGDLLHCDFGIVYIGLCTDTQQLAYVLKEGETDAPEGLKKAMIEGNRLQDIHLEEMKAGRTGNEVLAAALKRAKDEGLKPSIYTHPLGRHGHAAGPVIGLWDKQGGVPGTGDFPLFYDTVWSIELNVRSVVPEWNNQEVTIALEQDAALTKEGAHFLDVRPTTIRLIR